MSKMRLLFLGFTFMLILTIGAIFQSNVLGQSTVDDFQGFAGYITSPEELNNTIAIMKNQNLSTYRISFRPSWLIPEGSIKGYNAEFIDFLISSTNFSVIVDGNHLYPPTEASAQDARDHWADVRARIFQTLERYPNNSRVAVELLNEYASNDYNIQIQALIGEIRGAGYTNPIVTNKHNTPWLRFSDPLNNTYQGMHFYFNTWDSTGALIQMRIALSRGITKILNTEVGASSYEYMYYTQVNVDELKSFLTQSQALGISNCLWMNNDTLNWKGYTSSFNSNPAPTFSHPKKAISQTPKPTLSPTPKLTDTPPLASTSIYPTPQDGSSTQTEPDAMVVAIIGAVIVMVTLLSVFVAFRFKIKQTKA